MAIDDFGAIGLMDLPVEERAGQNLESSTRIDAALLQQSQDLAHALKR